LRPPAAYCGNPRTAQPPAWRGITHRHLKIISKDIIATDGAPMHTDKDKMLFAHESHESTRMKSKFFFVQIREIRGQHLLPPSVAKNSFFEMIS
jgi:hypothetical protein